MLLFPDQARRRIAQTESRLRSLVYPEVVPPEALEAGGPTGREGWPALAGLPMRPARLGQEFGPHFATHWIRVAASVPPEWAGARVDLLWDSQSEATVWRQGRPLQGLYSGWRALRTAAPLLAPATGGEAVEVFIELACNSWAGDDPPLAPGFDPELWARWRLGDTWLQPVADAAGWAPAANARLERCALGRFDQLAAELAASFDLLKRLEEEREQGLEPDWAGELLHGLDRFANTWDAADRGTWERAGAVLEELLGRRGPGPRHTVQALGHAHLDTAWVWPLAETRRKLVRTAANQLGLLDRYPGYRFCASSAQHYAWLEEDAPELFERVGEAVAEGRWELVGGSWIEPDCNLPAGESLLRQILYGQRYFEHRFGRRAAVYWSPDTFGHNGQMPQILRHCGIGAFVTQKLSWNQYTRPLHDSFRWRSPDGSEVLAHLPPVGTYNAELTPRELRHSVERFADHGRSGSSLLLFGHGDGGGGPVPEMLERLERVGDLRGLPAVDADGADAFFAGLESEREGLGEHLGELYFEYHRGTYTSQARTKRGNRRGELALGAAEAAAALAWALGAEPAYPGAELEGLWKRLLVNQFHDILPGTSLAAVHREAEAELAAVAEEADALGGSAVAALAAGSGEDPVPVCLGAAAGRAVLSGPGGGLGLYELPAFGFGRRLPDPPRPVAVAEVEGRVGLDNGLLRAELGADGALRSLVLRDGEGEREALAAPGNLFELYEDLPTAFDAWEVEPQLEDRLLETAAASSWEVLAAGPLRAEVRFELALGDSRIEQTVRLDAGAGCLELHCRVEWAERHRMLKLAFPLAVAAERATCGAAFGFAERPTHRNTAADLARFEVPGQGFCDLSEHGFGVALLAPDTYGFSARGAELRASLLRAPTDPDPGADRGSHELRFALMPHAGGWRAAGVAAAAAAFARRPSWARAEPAELLACESADLLFDAVKLAEDGGRLIVRLHETHGARGTARLRCAFPVAAARLCDGMEEPLAGGELRLAGGAVELPYLPHKILTVEIEPGGRV